MDSSEFSVTNSSFANNSADYVQSSVFAQRNDPYPPSLGLDLLQYRSFFQIVGGGGGVAYVSDSSEFSVTSSSFEGNSAPYAQSSVFAENDSDPPSLGLGLFQYRSFFPGRRSGLRQEVECVFGDELALRKERRWGTKQCLCTEERPRSAFFWARLTLMSLFLFRMAAWPLLVSRVSSQ